LERYERKSSGCRVPFFISMSSSWPSTLYSHV